MKPLTQEEFLKRSIIAHGDKYNYDKVIYEKNNKHVIIFCNTCNTKFSQIPVSHMQGLGCKYCGLHQVKGEKRYLQRSGNLKQKDLKTLKELIEIHGAIVITRQWLNANKKTSLNIHIERCWTNREEVAKELDVLDEFNQCVTEQRKACANKNHYVKWTDETFDVAIKDIIKQYECIPIAQFLIKNNHYDILQQINNKTWCRSIHELRKQYKVNDGNLIARNGIKYLSHSEVNVANFLIARDIKFENGYAYPQEYKDDTGKRGVYDFHIIMNDKTYNVEIWGGCFRAGEERQADYAATRKMKETFNEKIGNFIGIEYLDCHHDDTLTKVFQQYIGVIHPFVFTKSVDKQIPSTAWARIDKVIETAKFAMEKLNVRKVPQQKWFGRSGKYKNRKIEDWEPKSWSPFEWNVRCIGGYNKLREILKNH